MQFEIVSLSAELVEAKQPKNFVPTPFHYHEEVELKISDITNLGVGIGRAGNWVVMVPGVCIGEIVIAKIYKNLKNYSLSDLVSVVKPSPDRVQPKCELFGTCGGCQYQHMRYSSQLELKRHQVDDVMRRLAGIDFVPNACLHSEQEYNYRSKITPHFEKVVPPIGFLQNSSRKIVDVNECPIATYKINKELSNVRAKVIANKASYKRGGTLLMRDLGEKIITDYKATVSQKIGDFEFSFCAGEFFQNNPFMLGKLTDFVTTAAVGTKYLIDAYCGVGVFGIIAAKQFESVIGIEISDVAVRFAKENACKNSVDNISFIPGVAEKIFENISFAGDETSVIIDPPRAGCDLNFLSQLMTFSPAKIVYVSCAPDTQARDLKTLCEKYTIQQMQPIDMFPQTRHIENIVVLTAK